MNKEEASAPESTNNIQEEYPYPSRRYVAPIEEGEKEYEPCWKEREEKLIDSCKLCHAPKMLKRVERPHPYHNGPCVCCTYEEYYCKICLSSIRIYRDY